MTTGHPSQSSLQIKQLRYAGAWRKKVAAPGSVGPCDQGLSGPIRDPGDLKLTEHVPTPSLTPEMKPAEALLLTIKREEQAIKDYSVWPSSASVMRNKPCLSAWPLWSEATRLIWREYTKNCLRKMFLRYDRRKRPRIALECRNCK